MGKSYQERLSFIGLSVPEECHIYLQASASVKVRCCFHKQHAIIKSRLRIQTRNKNTHFSSDTAHSVCASKIIYMCGKTPFSQLTSSYQTINFSTFCGTKPLFINLFYLLWKVTLLQLSTKYLTVAVQEFRWVSVVSFTFFCIHFHSAFLPTYFSVKMLGNITLDLIFKILLHSANFYTKEIKIYIYLVIESNHVSNNTFINSRKQRIPNKLHILCRQWINIHL